MKQDILEEIRWELDYLIEGLDFDNLDESYNLIVQYLEFLKSLEKLPLNNEFQLSNSSEEDLEEIYDKENNLYIGQVHLLLGGAEFGSFKLFIPERIVRRLELEEGDWVRASMIDNRYYNGVHRPIYDYELLEKSEEEIETGRQLISFAPVEWDEGLAEHVISWEGEDKQGNKIVLNQHRLGNIVVKAGDLVDYAYYENDKLNGRVVWRHNIEYELAAEEKAPKNKKIKEERDEDPIFKNLTIAVIGKESKKSIFEEEVLRRGGDFVFFSGQENSEELSRGLKKVDLMVCFIDQVDHQKIQNIVDIGKKLALTSLYSRTIGAQSFVQLVAKNIKDSK